MQNMQDEYDEEYEEFQDLSRDRYHDHFDDDASDSYKDFSHPFGCSSCGTFKYAGGPNKPSQSGVEYHIERVSKYIRSMYKGSVTIPDMDLYYKLKEERKDMEDTAVYIHEIAHKQNSPVFQAEIRKLEDKVNSSKQILALLSAYNAEAKGEEKVEDYQQAPPAYYAEEI